MFFFFFFKNDLDADKKCDELNSIIEEIKETSAFNKLHKALTLACEILLLCKGDKLDENGNLISQSDTRIVSAYNYIVESNLLSEKAISILKHYRNKAAHGLFDRLKPNDIPIVLSDYSPIFNEISIELQKDPLGLSDSNHAGKYSNSIAWFSKWMEETASSLTPNNKNADVNAKYGEHSMKDSNQAKVLSKDNIESYIEELEESSDFDSWNGKTFKRSTAMLKCTCDETKPYIFVSYSHKDSEEVQKIIEKMYEEGYNVWFDEGIDPGTEWDEYIASHVEKAAYFIAFISKNYLESSNCKDELNYARDLEIERLIVYLENVELPKGMQMRLNRLQAIHKYKYSDIEIFYDKLLNSNELKDLKYCDIVFDKLFLDVGDYLISHCDKVKKAEIKEKFFAYDRQNTFYDTTINQLIALGIIEDTHSDKYFKVLIDGYGWKHILCDNIERKKLNDFNPDRFNDYNEYILRYFSDSDNYWGLWLKAVKTREYGEGFIENVFFEKDMCYLHIVFQNGHEGDFRVKELFLGNNAVIEYDIPSDYELVFRYGGLLYDDLDNEVTPDFAEKVLNGHYPLIINVKAYYDGKFENLSKLRKVIADCEKVYHDNWEQDLIDEFKYNEELEKSMNEATYENGFEDY